MFRIPQTAMIGSRISLNRTMISSRMNFNRGNIRNKSVIVENLKKVNELGKTIGDSRTDTSKNVIKYIRRIGVGSVAVVFASILLAAYAESTSDSIDDFNIDDMKLTDFKKE